MSIATDRQTAKQIAAQIENVHLYRMSTADHECPWGLKAVRLLNEKGIAFADHRRMALT